jgi:MoxR-like ATPase
MPTPTPSLAHDLITSISRSVIGKPDIVKLVVTALIAGGHVLLEDIPGTGKTLLAKSLAQSFQGSFRRIQFTSDLMPSDITGSSIFNLKDSQFEFIPGPIFAHIVLADEINRATPRSQSSLLEVMEEKQVTVDGVTHPMVRPFFVIATQNPIESYGTFPLPESQLDRFMVSLSMGYPTLAQEQQILQLHQKNTQKTQQTSLHHQLEALIHPEEVQQLSQAASQIEVSDEMELLLLAIVGATRNDSRIALGGSTRAAVAFLRMAQALAYIEGRSFIVPDDLKLLAPYVLSHRLGLKQPASRNEKLALMNEITRKVVDEHLKKR